MIPSITICSYGSWNCIELTVFHIAGLDLTKIVENKDVLLMFNSGSINDLPNWLLNFQPRMYADDTHLTFAANTISNIDRNLNENLSRVNTELAYCK